MVFCLVCYQYIKTLDKHVNMKVHAAVIAIAYPARRCRADRRCHPALLAMPAKAQGWLEKVPQRCWGLVEVGGVVE